MKSPPAAEYQQAIDRLAKLGRHLEEQEQREAAQEDRKQRKAELGALGKEAMALAKRLEETAEWSSLEDALGAARGESGQVAYASLCGTLRALAEEAENLSADVPDPRKRFTSRTIALLYVHVRSRCGMPRPVTTSTGDDVAELAEILRQAGVQSPTTDNAAVLLRAALPLFDPQMPPPLLASVI